MPSDGRRAPYIKATTRRRESDLTSSPYRPNYRESHHSEAERSILFQKSKKDKWRQIDSPPLPPSSTRPREKRRRSTSPSKPRSQRPRYDNLHTSRLPSPSRSSRIETRRCDNLGCGLQHSHDDCNRPMQCRGCRSTQHFGANCHEFCVECGQIGHIKAYCSEFVVGSDGKSRPKGWSREYSMKRQRELDDVSPAQEDSDRPQNSPELRSDSLQRRSSQPSNPTSLSSLASADTPPKSSQRLAFEEEESIKQARHEADMARRAAVQKLELEHEVRLLEVRRQSSLLPSNATSSSVLLPPYDPNRPLEIPNYVSVEAPLTTNAPAAVNGNQGRGGEQRIKKEEDIKYEIID